MGFDARGGRQTRGDDFPEIIGRSAEISAVLDLVHRVAPSDSAVLIGGESGTGKELIAKAIHRLSSRSNKQMLAINCSAIPENLLESELFGHERGAFTGADRRRQGYFESAAGGTVFLDEIGEMTIALQSKLLRVLQEKKFTPLGGTQAMTADVRIIAATNIDLEQAIREERRFRLDLYYRLNVLPIYLSPLRERQDDIVDLLTHLLQVYNKKYKVKSECYFNPETINVLRTCPWPGNVRQLQNLVERLILTCGGGEIKVSHLPPEYCTTTSETKPEETSSPPVHRAGATAFGQPGFKLSEHVEQLENQFIIKALRTTNNNKNKAAQILGLNRTTLVEKIKKRNITC